MILLLKERERSIPWGPNSSSYTDWVKKKNILCTFVFAHSLFQQVDTKVNFMPSIAVGTGDAAVDNRQKFLPSWSFYSSRMRKTTNVCQVVIDSDKCYGENQGKEKGQLSCNGGGGCCSPEDHSKKGARG